MTTYVVTPCKRSRVDELIRLVDSLAVEPDHVVVITTQPDPIEPGDLKGRANHLLRFTRPGMLFGEWFNLGFQYLAGTDDPYEVLCVGSSLICGPDTIPQLRDALRTHDLTMVGPDIFGHLGGGQVDIQHAHDQRTLHNRVLANCFMVRGELGLRFDPEFRWWYSDDDLEMQARQFGPVGNVGGVTVRMTHPDGHYLTEEQAIWATEDRAKFVEKWQKEPW